MTRGFKNNNNNKYIFAVCCIIAHDTRQGTYTIIIYDVDTREVYSLNTLNDVKIVYNSSINV